MNNFEVGTILVALPSFNNKNNQEPYYGGAGYKENIIFIISKISYYGGKQSDFVYWSRDFEHGILSHAVRLATEEEIELYNKGYRNIYQLFL